MKTYSILPENIQQKLADLDLSREAFRRLDWIQWYKTHDSNAQATCRHFSLSKSVFYRWLNRFDPYAPENLDSKNKDKKPWKLRQMTTDPELINLITQIRLQNPKQSKYKIHDFLLKNGVKVSHSVIQKVINRHSLQKTKLY